DGQVFRLRAVDGARASAWLHRGRARARAASPHFGAKAVVRTRVWAFSLTRIVASPYRVQRDQRRTSVRSRTMLGRWLFIAVVALGVFAYMHAHRSDAVRADVTQA